MSNDLKDHLKINSSIYSGIVVRSDVETIFFEFKIIPKQRSKTYFFNIRKF